MPGRGRTFQNSFLCLSRPSLSGSKRSAPRQTLQTPPPPDPRRRRVVVTVLPPTYKTTRRSSVKPLFIVARPYPLLFSLSSTFHKLLSPATIMPPSIEVIPGPTKQPWRRVSSPGASWRSTASRGAGWRENFDIPFHPGSPENARLSSSPTTPSIGKWFISLRSIVRISSTFYFFLNRLISSDCFIAGVHRRGDTRRS
jgi:hypothetical protein